MIPFAKTAPTGTTSSRLVITAGTRERVRLQYINATSDKALSALTFHQATDRTLVLATSPSSQKVIHAAPYPGATENDVVILVSKATGKAVRGVVDDSDDVAQTITLKDDLNLDLAAGDAIYLMQAGGQIAVGATTKEVNAPTIFATMEGPVLVELDGTSACRINLVAGEYF